MNVYSDQAQQTNGDQVSSRREGTIARKIEKQTAKIPSDVFLWAAGGAMLISLGFEVAGMIRGQRREMLGGILGHTPKTSAPLASFVGHWVPTLLLLGVYNKIVKTVGSDQYDR